MPEDRYQTGDKLTPRQLASRLNVSVGTLANWRNQGIGPDGVRLTPTLRGRVRYPLQAVIEWENSRPCIVSSVTKDVEAAHGSL